MNKVLESNFKISRAIAMGHDLAPAPAPVPSSQNDADQRRGLIQEYYRTVMRHRWAIAAFVASGIAGGLLLNLNSVPVYRARTSLDIQSFNSDFLNMHAVAPTADSESSSEVYVQTQIKLLQSEELLERTEARVQAEPHPEFVNRAGLISDLKRMFHVAHAGQISYADLVNYAALHVTVKPLGVTRLVEVTCDSWSASFSARFCNALVDQFKEDDLNNRSSEAKNTSEWLTRQVADVKAKAQESQKELEAVTGGNGLILSQESTGVEEQRLRELQSEYVKAEADRMQKEAEAGISSSVSPALEPDLAQSVLYQEDERKLEDLKGQIAKLVPPHTEEYPQVVHLRAQIAELEAGMAAERAKNARHLQTDYATALHREAMLGAAFRAEESKVSSDLGRASRVALLRGEVSSEQQLYQTLLDRAKEAGFASAMHASTIRVVDAAKPPVLASSPRWGATTFSGLLLGGLFGVCFAFVKERNTSVFRIPGEAQRVLGLRELGVIPTSARDRSSLEHGSGAALRPLELLPAKPLTLPNWGKDGFSIVAEAYRSATVSILLSDTTPKQGRVYVISSPNAGEGKTTVTSNLGVALSRSRLRVLLVDGDLRKPSLHRALRVRNDFGLRDLLHGEYRGADSLRTACQPTIEPNLFVLPAGPESEDVVEMLNSTEASDLMRRLRFDFDVVLIDTPPMLHMADARVLATYAQGAILILRAGLTTWEEAAKARDLFAQDQVRVIGTILNDFDPKKNGLGSYYGSYYRYQQDPSQKEEVVPA